MQRLEVSGAVRLIYRSLGVKGLRMFLLHGFHYLFRKVIKIKRGNMCFKGPQTVNPRKPGRGCHVVQSYQVLDSGCYVLQFVYQKTTQ